MNTSLQDKQSQFGQKRYDNFRILFSMAIYTYMYALFSRIFERNIFVDDKRAAYFSRKKFQRSPFLRFSSISRNKICKRTKTSPDFNSVILAISHLIK